MCSGSPWLLSRSRLKGQFIYVGPVTDVVVVRTGVDFGIEDWPAVLADVVDRVSAAD